MNLGDLDNKDTMIILVQPAAASPKVERLPEKAPDGVLAFGVVLPSVEHHVHMIHARHLVKML